MRVGGENYSFKATPERVSFARKAGTSPVSGLWATPIRACLSSSHLPSAASVASRPSSGDSARAACPTEHHGWPNISIHRSPASIRKKKRWLRSLRKRQTGPVPLPCFPNALAEVSRYFLLSREFFDRFGGNPTLGAPSPADWSEETWL